MSLLPVELQIATNFSFLHGASHAEELAIQAKTLGYEAIGITDRNTMAGIVRAFDGCNKAGIRLVVGCRLDLQDAPSLLCYPQDRAAYGRLCTLLTIGKRRTEKGKCLLTYQDVLDHRVDQQLVALAPEKLDETFAEFLKNFRSDVGKNAHLAANHLYRGDDVKRIRRLAELAADHRLPLIATNDVLYHIAERRPLQDVMTCIREHVTIEEAGFRLLANAERHLKTPAEMQRLFRRWPQALENAARLADECRFSLAELQYDYPSEPVPEGLTPQQHLEQLTWEGAARRYPAGIPDKVTEILKSELRLIERLKYAPYFLTVQDIVRFAESQGILCQGRGSAANSLVCYCLRITAIGLDQANLLFERFVSSERNEPPDIDVDFEHERREEVIQYIYDKYGRDRAGIAATVISYRPKSALREVGKVFGLTDDVLNRLSKSIWGWGDKDIVHRHIEQAGLDPSDHRLRQVMDLAGELIGFPRHLSQHVGGFVITRGKLHEYVPIENAAMEKRTFIEWDKDDLDTLKMLKIDVLALGMLTCIRKGFDLLKQHEGESWALHTIPKEQPDVYDMLCKADSIGVFQVESRAQMSMLPRLKPRKFYDLVIEVAIVRPGPIQGDMVHPYLRRRDGLETVTYPSEELREVLKETYGIPLFQEHAMRIAMVAAGFTAEESDQLRRAMATFRRAGTIGQLRDKFIDGMVGRGYIKDFAERCFKQIEGFADYGFPESHAASFALLVYVSAWMKCRYPAVFACAILNSQPMGFYAPAQLVRDARDHGVAVRPVDVNVSAWDNTLERGFDGKLALRLGFREIFGCRREDAEKLIAARGSGYRSLHEFWRKSRLGPAALEVLAKADAFGSLELDRRRALWQIHALGEGQLPLFDGDQAAAPADHGWPSHIPVEDLGAPLPEMSVGEHVLEDYHALGLSLRAHPLKLLRHRLQPLKVTPNHGLATAKVDSRIKVAGLVLVRQRPGTASGVIFMTLEDETGVANIVVWPKVFEQFRRTVLTSRLIAIEGKLQREGLVIHVIADRMEDLTHLLNELGQEDGHWDRAIAHADEVKRAVTGDQRLMRLRSRDFH